MWELYQCGKVPVPVQSKWKQESKSIINDTKYKKWFVLPFGNKTNTRNLQLDRLETELAAAADRIGWLFSLVSRVSLWSRVSKMIKQLSNTRSYKWNETCVFIISHLSSSNNNVVYMAKDTRPTKVSKCIHCFSFLSCHRVHFNLLTFT